VLAPSLGPSNARIHPLTDHRALELDIFWAVAPIVCGNRIRETTMRVIRFAVGMSLVAINSATNEGAFSLHDGCCQSIFTSPRWKPLVRLTR
jgi:hypothetical protein